jgi:hypothetical protein
MAYNTANPPVRINFGGLTSFGATEAGTDYGGNSIWLYKSADAIAAVLAAGYIADGIQRGMQPGDLVLIHNTTGGPPYAEYLAQVGSTTPTVGGLPGMGSVSLIATQPILAQEQYSVVAGGTPLTLLAANMAGAADVIVNLTANLGGAGAVTSDTAANIVAAIAGAAVGLTYKLRIINSSAGAFAWTLGAGAGVTVTGTATMAQNTWREFAVTVTALGAVPTVTLQNVGTGTFS